MFFSQIEFNKINIRIHISFRIGSISECAARREVNDTEKDTQVPSWTMKFGLIQAKMHSLSLCNAISVVRPAKYCAIRGELRIDLN